MAFPRFLQDELEKRRKKEATEKARKRQRLNKTADDMTALPEFLQSKEDVAIDRTINRSEIPISRKQAIIETNQQQAARGIKLAKQRRSSKGSASTAGKIGAAAQAVSSSGAGDGGVLGDVAGGAAAGTAVMPGYGTIIGAGLGLAKGLAKQKQKKKDIKADAIRKIGNIQQETGNKKADAIRDMMDAFASALLGGR